MADERDKELVIREVAKDVVIFSKPFTRGGLVPIGGRSTAIKMQDGGVWVLASTPLTEATKAKLTEMGPVRYICGADRVHHLFLGDFKRAYPEAKLVGVHEALGRSSDKELKFDGAWGQDPPDTKYGFESDVQHCYFSGFQNKDVAFFHPASKTLIQADLLFNLPATEQYSKTESSGKIPIFGSLGPSSWLHQKFGGLMGVDKTAMKKDVKTVADWDFERIIPCHGDVIEKTGKQAWLDAYRSYL